MSITGEILIRTYICVVHFVKGIDHLVNSRTKQQKVASSVLALSDASPGHLEVAKHAERKGTPPDSREKIFEARAVRLDQNQLMFTGDAVLLGQQIVLIQNFVRRRILHAEVPTEVVFHVLVFLVTTELLVFSRNERSQECPIIGFAVHDSCVVGEAEIIINGAIGWSPLIEFNLINSGAAYTALLYVDCPL